MRFRGTGALLAFALAGCMSAVTPSDPTIASTANAAALTHPNIWPSAASPSAISDAKTENEISALIAKMTIEQKIGQLIQADISAVKPQDLAEYPLGSILAGGNSGPYGDERASAAKWSQLVTEFRGV